MNRTRKAIVVAATTGALIAGCTGAAHLKALQPPAVPASHPLFLAKPVAPPAMRLGIDVDAYTYPGQNIPAAAAATVAYVRSLHANAVAITFPFFMAGPGASRVYATGATPTPAQLAVVVRAAERAGLYVTIRPLLDETDLGHARTQLHFAYPAQWFASYERFLLPYAAMAQRAHVGTLVVGTELTNLRKFPDWNLFNAVLRAQYRGTLQFDSNWSGHPKLAGAGGQGIQEAVDAYPPLGKPLTRRWETYDKTLPAGTIESEVGIGAAPDAFASPWRHQYPGQPITPQTQAQWFGAACHAAVATHLGGIYFWSIGLGTRFSGPTGTSPLNWARSLGAQAISACFAAEQKVPGR